MPLATNPKRTFPVTLESDKDLPEAERPTFRFRFPTGMQTIELEEFQRGQAESKGKSRSQFIRELDAMVSAFLAGWEKVRDSSGNLVVYMPSAKLMDVLAVDDLWHLFWALVYATALSVPEKNSSGSASAASTDSPAPAEKAASAVPATKAG